MSGSPSAHHALQHFTLPNGLQVYLQEDHRAPLVSAQLWYHVGSSYEPDGHTGLSHALEHLMFEGSSKLSGGQYSRLMTRLGGDPTAFTTDDATVYPLTLPSKHLEIVLEAMADAMHTATLSEAPFARELKVVMAERRVNVDNSPLSLAHEKHQILAHGKSRYATPVIGLKDDLHNMTREAARTWYQSWYHPNNATLSVAGATSLTHLKTLVERHFGAIPAHRLPHTSIPRQDSDLKHRSQALHAQGLREGVLMSFNTPSLATASTAEQAHALHLIPALLTKGAASRLMSRLVVETSVLHGITASYGKVSRGDSLLSIYAYNNPVQATPQAAAESILLEIEALRRSAPTEEELQRAKAQLMASQVYAQDSIYNQAASAGQLCACGLDPMALLDDRQALQAVTGERVRQAAEDYLGSDRLAITHMHGEENADD